MIYDMMMPWDAGTRNPAERMQNMRNFKTWTLLQLFADGEGGSPAGEGGNASAVDTPADDGRAKLLALGVPAEKLRNGRSYSVPKSAAPAKADVTTAQEQRQDDAAMEPETAQEPQEAAKKPTWDEIMKDPDYKKQASKMMESRVAKSKQVERDMETILPALKKYAQNNGLDPENLDFVALGKHMNGDYESKALEMGVSEQTAMEMDQRERQEQQRQFAAHISRLEEQAEAMKQVYPDFDLRKEMENPVFLRMTSPGVNVPVETAYYAIHKDEIQRAAMQVSARKTAQMMANAVASGSVRPNEGTMNQATAPAAPRDYRSYTKEEREALKKRILASQFSGEKIYPGM